MAMECGGVNIRAGAFKSEILVVKYEVWSLAVSGGKRSLPFHSND
jgi:hypothetical protein